MSEKVTQLVDHYFREEYGKAVSFLTNKYGARHLELAEDAVQEALYKAIQTWSYGRIPNNPSGWIVTVASNKLIDHFRKAARVSDEAIPDRPVDAHELDLGGVSDDVIRMMFACCHPSLSMEYQIILTLKILGGLSIREIARALLKKEESIAKSYTRAKKKFKEENIALILPSSAEINNRIRTELHILYLLFNEGYKTTEGVELLRKDLCLEAIRLNRLLLENEATNTSMANSLMALMLLHTARFSTRTDEKGDLVTLEHQDRNRWDQTMLNQGMKYLQIATRGSFLNEYYLQAAILALHCQAPTFADTPWSAILEVYDTLVRINPAPIVQLNRIVALSKATSPEAALNELEHLEAKEELKSYYLLFAIKGNILADLSEIDEAVQSLEKAISLTNNQAEVNHLRKKINALRFKRND